MGLNPHFRQIVHSKHRPEWLEARRTLGIGASEVAGVLGRSRFASPLSVYTDHVLAKEDRDNDAMFWGRTLEPVIIDHYKQLMGQRTRKFGWLLQSKRWPFLLATLDAQTWIPSGEWEPLEVKNSRVEFPDGQPPFDYWVQMQTQMAVTGKSHCAFAVLCWGADFYYDRVERDDKFIEGVIVPECEAMWRRIERGEPPNVEHDASDATKEAIKRLYPSDDGTEINLGGAFIPDANRRESLMRDIAHLAEQKAEIDNKLKAAIGGHSKGNLPDGRSFSNKADKNGKRTLRAHAAKR